jgi:hypothetical protein
MMWMGYVPCTEEITVYKILVRKQEGRRSLEYLDVDERTLKWILKKQGERMSDAAKCQQSDYYLLNKGCAQ